MSTPSPRRVQSRASAVADGETLPVRKLVGHSGATLVLYERKPAGIVRKVAADHARNERLQRQSALQRRLSGYGLPFPRVLKEGIDDSGLAFFEMEYVPADDLASLLREAGDFDRQAVVATLERALRFFHLTRGELLPAASFHRKIEQVAAQCAGLQSCAPHLPKISAAAMRLNGLQWSEVPSSLCHGDMTTENMLYSRARGLVFIDCDDCFVSSYWLDAAKLFQDVAGRWCLRDLYLAGNPEAAAAARRLDAFAPALRAMLAFIDPLLASRLPQFAALNLFRTLPYAKDERLVGFVLEHISRVLDGAGL